MVARIFFLNNKADAAGIILYGSIPKTRSTA
jgi:hypothetical protein